VVTTVLPETSNIFLEESVMEDNCFPEASNTLVTICPEASNKDNICPEESNMEGIGCPEASYKWGNFSEGIGELRPLVLEMPFDTVIYNNR
jgi:hypothetical protein